MGMPREPALACLPQDPTVTCSPHAASKATGSLAQFTGATARVTHPRTDPGRPPEWLQPTCPWPRSQPVTPTSRIAGLAESITDGTRGNSPGGGGDRAPSSSRTSATRGRSRAARSPSPLSSSRMRRASASGSRADGADARMSRATPARWRLGSWWGCPAWVPGGFLVRTPTCALLGGGLDSQVGWVAVDPTPSMAPARTDVSLNASPSRVALIEQNRAFNIEEPLRGGGRPGRFIRGQLGRGLAPRTVVVFEAPARIGRPCSSCIGGGARSSRRTAASRSCASSTAPVPLLRVRPACRAHPAGDRAGVRRCCSVRTRRATPQGSHNRFAAGVPRRPGSRSGAWCARSGAARGLPRALAPRAFRPAVPAADPLDLAEAQCAGPRATARRWRAGGPSPSIG